MGECAPVVGGQHKSVQCVAVLAGMFGAQVAEGMTTLRRPENDNKFEHYGASSSDLPTSVSLCKALIANRTEGWIYAKTLASKPELKADSDKQKQIAEKPIAELQEMYMQLALDLVSLNRLAVINLAKLLLNQSLERLTPVEHEIEDYPLTTLSVHRISGEKVEEFLLSQKLGFRSQLLRVQDLGYPKGYEKVFCSSPNSAP